MAKVKRFYNGIALEPLSADPSSPVEGQVQFSDGTVRASGLWQYKDSAWKAIGGGGAGGFHIFESFDADADAYGDWTSSAGTWGEDTTNELSGDKSYKWTPNAQDDTLDSPTVTLPKRTTDKAGEGAFMCQFAYAASNDGFQAIIKDNSSNVLATMDIDSTKNTAQIFFDLVGTETSVTIQIKDATHTASMNIVFDDMIFSDEPFRKVDTLEQEEYFIHDITAFGSTDTKIPYYTNVETDTTGSIVSVSNNSTNGLTITAKTTCRLYMNAHSHWSGSGENFGISLNSSELTTNIQSLTNEEDIVTASSGVANGQTAVLDLVAGDIVRPHAGNTYATTGTSAQWNVRFHAVSTNQSVVVENAVGSEWTDDGVITIDATTTAPTKATTTEVDKAIWRRQGDSAEVIMEYEATDATGAAAGSGIYLYKMPAGLKIDMTNLNATGNDYTGTVLGHGRIGRTSYAVLNNEAYMCVVKAYDEDYVQVHYQANATQQVYNGSSRQPINTANWQLSIRFTAPVQGWTSVQNHVMDIADPYENTYSARIDASLGASVAVTSETGNLVSTVVQGGSGSGYYDITWGETFTVAPAVVGTLEASGTFVSIYNVTTTGCTAEIRIHTGAVADEDFTILVQRQGADYREPKGYFLGNVANEKYIEKILSADVTSTGDISDFAFTGLTVGKYYEVSGALLTNSASNIKGTFDNGATVVGLLQNNGGSSQTFYPSFKFLATDTTLDLNLSAAGASDKLQGNGTTAESYLQLKECDKLRKVSSF